MCPERGSLRTSTHRFLAPGTRTLKRRGPGRPAVDRPHPSAPAARVGSLSTTSSASVWRLPPEGRRLGASLPRVSASPPRWGPVVPVGALGVHAAASTGDRKRRKRATSMVRACGSAGTRTLRRGLPQTLNSIASLPPEATGRRRPLSEPANHRASQKKSRTSEVLPHSRVAPRSSE